MTRVAILGILGTIFAACGGGGGLSETDACKQYFAVFCNMTSTCSGTAGLSALGYTSLAECTTSEQAACVSTPTCKSNEVYHSDNAQTCIDQTKAQGCTDFTNNVTPPSCDLVCM